MEKQEKKVYLDLNHAFGSNFAADSSNEIGIIEEEGKFKLIFTVGKTIAKQTIDTLAMEFIKLSDNVDCIECIAISPTRNHIAVCQKLKNENFLLLNLYGLKSRDSEIKHFKLPQTEKQSSFRIIAFSPSQPKYACCMTGEPDSQLMFLDISRSRGLAVSNFSVQGTDSIAICPTQSHLISCAGRNIFKLFKVEDYSFKAYEEVKKLPKQRNFTAHQWFDKTKILIGTDWGELFMIGPVGNNFEVKRNLNVFTPETPEQPVSLASICVFSRGFILGSSKGHFSLWMKKEQSEDNFEDEYTGDLVKKWQVGQGRVAAVRSMALCPQQERLAVAFSNGSIATTTLSSLLAADELDQNSKSIQGDILSYLHSGFHPSEINSMDICLHRPILATLSKKQSCIRLWNYKKPRCELVKLFDAKVDGIQEVAGEMINCLAMHPLGYYMAVGCCDKLRVYHILENQLRNFRQIVLRGVCTLRFSHGGQFLAAAYPRQKSNLYKYNIHLINIYNAYTLEQIGRLSDHSNIITDLTWRPDDRALYSVGADGTASEWRQNEGKGQGKEWACKKWAQGNSKYSTVIYQRSGRSILAAGFQSSKPVIREFKVEKEQAQKLFSLGFRVSRLQWLTSQWNIPAVIAGTQDGCIKVFNSPFDNIVEQSLNVHRREVVSMATSPCGRYVISVGKDGVIFVYQVSLTNRQGFVNKRLHEQVSQYEINPLIGVLDDELADVVLVQRNDVNEKNRYTKLLEKNLEEMKRKLVLQDDDESRRYDAEMKEFTEEKQKKIDSLNAEFDQLKEEKKKLELYSQANFVETEGKNQKMLEDIETLYEKKLAIQNKRYFELESTYEKVKADQTRQINLMKKKTAETIQLLKKEFMECFRKAEKVHNGQQSAIVDGQKQFNEKVNQLQEEHEQEIKKISEGMEEMEIQKNKKSLEYVTSIESLKRQCRILHDQIIKYMSETEMLDKTESHLRIDLQEINSLIKSKKNELQEKQESLKVRQQKIGQFQERIGDLQKKKQVLSYRTWQMRQQIEPKEDQIEFLKQEIYSLERQFQNLLNDEKAVNEVLARLKKSKDQLSIELSEQKIMTKDRKARMKRICDDIDAIVQSKQSDRRFYEHQMKMLHQKYSSMMTEGRKINQSEKGVDEMQRHMTHIDREIGEANRKTDTTIKKRDEQIKRATQQNADLIEEVGELREQKLRLASELKNVQKIIDSLKRQTIQIKNATAGKGGMAKRATSPDKEAVQDHQGQVGMARSASQPMIKGRVAKGINYDAGNLSIFSKAKVKELENKLELARVSLKQKQLIGRILHDKIKEHLEKGECKDLALEKCLSDFQI